MEVLIVLTVLGSIVAAPVLGYLLWKRTSQAKAMAAKLRTLTDVEAEAAKVKRESEAAASHLKHQTDLEVRRMRGEAEAQVARVQHELSEYVQKLEELRKESTWLEAKVFAHHVNLPDDDFADAGEYADALKDLRSEQKEMAKSGLAAVCHTTWHVGDSIREGEKMVKRTLDLMLRAFNGECDGIVTRAKAGNEEVLGARIEKAAKQVNRLGDKMQCELTGDYVKLKLRELHLFCAYQIAVELEKDEQRQIREQMREEAKVQKELEKARKEAEDEEKRFARALIEARRQFESASEGQKAAFQAKLAELEAELAEAHAKAERAISQAQLTRAGHVYIISNVGSFGEHVYKIGMTRRLVPQERVDELGDASVPFRFDIHAMIYSEDAPALENALHSALDLHRVNKVNFRKEFFRVSLDDVRQIVEQHHGQFRLTMAAEAAEYRRTIELSN